MSGLVHINRTDLLQRLEAVSPGLSKGNNEAGLVEQSACFTADTVIHTLSGNFTVQELIAQGHRTFKVYSTDGTSLRIGDAFGLRKTRRRAKVFEVRFDTGESIKLTADHLVMMRDGSYLRVDQVKVGSSVMPFNYRIYEGRRWVYPQVFRGSSVRAAPWVYQEVHGKVEGIGNRQIHVHHADDNRLNDDPENLELVTDSEHARIHVSVTNPMHKPGAAAKISKGMRGNKRAVGPKSGTAKAMLGNQHALKAPHPDAEVQRAREEARLRMQALRASKNNHKVVSVLYIGREDVYDLSVHRYHNFAANGVFIHNCFVFKNGKVHTYNDEVSCSIKSGFPKEYTGAAFAEELKSTLSKRKDEEIGVELAEGEIILKGRRKATGITTEKEVRLALDSLGVPTEWQKLPEAFGEAVTIVQECAGKDESKFATTCIHINGKWMEAMDNYQVTRYRIAMPIKEPILLRRESLKHITSLDMTEYAETDEWVHFRNPAGLTFAVRRYVVEGYPNLSSWFKFKGEETDLPKDLASAADIAQTFIKSGDKDSAGILVELFPGKIRLTGKGDTGWHSQWDEIEYKGKEISFMIAPKLFMELVKRHSRCEVSEDRIKVNGGAFTYVASLGRFDDETGAEGEATGEGDLAAVSDSGEAEGP